MSPASDEGSSQRNWQNGDKRRLHPEFEIPFRVDWGRAVTSRKLAINGLSRKLAGLVTTSRLCARNRGLGVSRKNMSDARLLLLIPQ